MGSALASQRVEEFWRNTSSTLNSIGTGATKEAQAWKTYWHELKYRARKRDTEIRQHARGTGGGPAKKPLTPIETRILLLLGEVSYAGNPEVSLYRDLLYPNYYLWISPDHKFFNLVLAWIDYLVTMPVLSKVVFHLDMGVIDGGKFCLVKDKFATANGYCYLKYFYVKGYTINDLLYVADSLGPFPKVRTLTDVLDRVCSKDEMVPRPTGLVHVPNDKITMRYRDFRELYRHLDYRIGGDFLPSSLVPSIVRRAGLDYEEEVTKILSRDMGNPESALAEMVRNSLINDAKRLLHPRTKEEKIVVRYQLTPEDESSLITTFPELDIEFKHDVRHSHAYAAASRQLESQINMMTLGINRGVCIPPGYDALVKHSGGCVFKAITRGRDDFHVCSPILSVHDQQRHANRFAALATYIPRTLRQKRAYYKFNEDLRDGTELFSCEKASETCRIRAPYQTFLHSTYDRTCRQIADSMTAAGSIVGSGSFIFDPLMLVETSGTISHLNVYWRIDDEKGEKMLSMGFQHDSSWSYVHTLKNYIDLITSPVILDSQGKAYFVNIQSTRNSVVFFKIVKNASRGLLSGVVRRYIWFDSLDYVSVQAYLWEANGFDSDKNHMRLVRFIAPKKLVNDTIKYAMGLDHNRFSVQRIYEALKSFVTRVVGTKAVCVASYNLPAERMYQLASAVFIHCFVQRFSISRATSEVTNEILKLREQSGFSPVQIMKNLWEKLTDKTAQVPSDVKNSAYAHLLSEGRNPGNVPLEGVGPLNYGTTSFHRFFGKLIEWSAIPTKYSVSITDAVKFIELKTFIEGDYDSLEKLPENYLPCMDVISGDDPLRDTPLSDEACGIERVPTSESEKLGPIDAEPTEADVIGLDDLVEGEAVGDGNCLFDAARQLLDPDVTVKQFKGTLLTSPKLSLIPAYLLSDLIAVLKSENEWGGEPEMQLIAHTYGVRFVLYSDELNYKPRIYCPDNITIYIKLEKNHFTPLRPKIVVGGAADAIEDVAIDTPSSDRTLDVSPARSRTSVGMSETQREVKEFDRLINDLEFSAEHPAQPRASMGMSETQREVKVFNELIDNLAFSAERAHCDDGTEVEAADVDIDEYDCTFSPQNSDILNSTIVDENDNCYEAQRELFVTLDETVCSASETSCCDDTLATVCLEADSDPAEWCVSEVVREPVECAVSDGPAVLTPSDAVARSVWSRPAIMIQVATEHKWTVDSKVEVLFDLHGSGVTPELRKAIGAALVSERERTGTLTQKTTAPNEELDGGNWCSAVSRGRRATAGFFGNLRDRILTIPTYNRYGVLANDVDSVEPTVIDTVVGGIKEVAKTIPSPCISRAVRRIVGRKRRNLVETKPRPNTCERNLLGIARKQIVTAVVGRKHNDFSPSEVADLTSKGGPRPLGQRVVNVVPRRRVRPFTLETKKKKIDTIVEAAAEGEHVDTAKQIRDFDAKLPVRSRLEGEQNRLVVVTAKDSEHRIIHGEISAEKDCEAVGNNLVLNFTNTEATMTTMREVIELLNRETKECVVDLRNVDGSSVKTKIQLLTDMLPEKFSSILYILCAEGFRECNVGVNVPKIENDVNGFWKPIENQIYDTPRHNPKFILSARFLVMIVLSMP